MDYQELNEEDMGQSLISSDELKKAKKIVQKFKNDYYIKAAKDGSKWKFINYAYIPRGFECEWCGNTNGPPKHAYFIEKVKGKKQGQRKVIGSVCINKVTKLGKAYREIPEFKKKINKLQRLRDWDRDEFRRKVMEASGEKKKVMIELQEIEEQLEKKKKEDEQARKERLNKARNDESIEEQKKWIEDNNLEEIRKSSDFASDVLSQIDDNMVLSEKQKNSLMNCKNKVKEIYGSINEWKEQFNKENKIIEAIEDFRYSGRSIYSKHREFIDSILEQYEEGRYYPVLSDRQLDALEDILNHYSIEY